MVQPLQVASVARRPTADILINDVRVPTLAIKEFSVNTNSYFAADTFSVQVALSSLPAQFSPAFWSSTEAITCEVRAGFIAPETASAGTLDTLVYGDLDDVALDWRTGTLTLTGRDLTARFIDAVTSEKFANLTSSAIVALLAARHGIDAAVTPTATLAGRYYELEHAKLTREVREWDLITYLAQQENFIVYMDGKTLRFVPAPDVAGAEPYLLQYVPSQPGQIAQGNWITMTTQRNLTLASDIAVIVRGWNQKQAAGFTKTFKSTKRKRGGGHSDRFDKPQTYVFTLANATLEQVIQFGQRKLAELSRHERLLEFDMPASSTANINMASTIRLVGTGTDWDQDYFADSVVRRMSPGEGYRMHVRAKNHSPNSQVIV